jgi:hypothetical protein
MGFIKVNHLSHILKKTNPLKSLLLFRNQILFYCLGAANLISYIIFRQYERDIDLIAPKKTNYIYLKYNFKNHLL